MNRSCRRAATIAVGVLYAVGWATLGAAGASADSGSDGGGGADRVAAAPAKRGFRPAPPVPPCPPCPFCPPCPIWPSNWWTKNRNSHAEYFEPPAVFIPAPVTAISATTYTTPTIDHYLADHIPEVPGVLESPEGPGQSAAAALSGPVAAGPSLGGPLIPYPSPTPTPAVSPPAPERPASPIAPPPSPPAPAGSSRTETVAAQPTLAELGLLALPGAAALAGLTGLGGYLGYRQAKAGFALRAVATARFLP